MAFVANIHNKSNNIKMLCGKSEVRFRSGTPIALEANDGNACQWNLTTPYLIQSKEE